MSASLRLHKYLAAAGVASLRNSEAFINDGRIMVNGVRARVGDRVGPGKDKITFDLVQVPVPPALLPA